MLKQVFFVGDDVDVTGPLTEKEYVDGIGSNQNPVRVFTSYAHAQKVATLVEEGDEEVSEKYQFPIYTAMIAELPKEISYYPHTRIPGKLVNLSDLKFTSASLEHVSDKFKPFNLENVSIQATPAKRSWAQTAAPLVKPGLAVAATTAAWYFGGLDYLAAHALKVLPEAVASSVNYVTGAATALTTWATLEVGHRGQQWVSGRNKDTKKSEAKAETKAEDQVKPDQVEKLKETLKAEPKPKRGKKTVPAKISAEEEVNSSVSLKSSAKSSPNSSFSSKSKKEEESPLLSDEVLDDLDDLNSSAQSSANSSVHSSAQSSSKHSPVKEEASPVKSSASESSATRRRGRPSKR